MNFEIMGSGSLRMEDLFMKVNELLFNALPCFSYYGKINHSFVIREAEISEKHKICLCPYFQDLEVLYLKPIHVNTTKIQFIGPKIAK